MPELPVMQHAQHLLAAAKKSRRLIISSPPGSGKSTKVPQLLADSAGLKGRIAVLEPRRLAARMLATRVAQERKCAVGGEVGYRVRFENKTGPATRIIFETEGILLRELVSDPHLEKYSAIILDEFHERHIHGDIMLAACLALQRGPRPDLLVAAMSATLDERALSGYMSPCETIRAEGTLYPVETVYCGADMAKLPPWEAAAQACARVLPKIDEGHSLVFMPGVYEINRTIAALSARRELAGFEIKPLHGELPPREQDAALAHSARRKIIVATNIAETSLTIDGVTAVVDSGLARIARFDAARGINTLFTEKISAPSATQRAGRAGRTAPGVCLRLWTEVENKSHPLSLEPEILRLDLSEALLALKASGIDGFDALQWPDNPSAGAVADAKKLLLDLNATDSAGKLTATGKAMSSYPLHPRYSRMLVEGMRLGCAQECALVAAAAQGRGIWQDSGPAPQTPHGLRSDLASVVRALEFCAGSNFDFEVCRREGLRAPSAAEVWKIANRMVPHAGRESASPALVAQCFLRAFPDRVAGVVSGEHGRYQLPGGRRATLDKNSAASGAEIICAGEILESQKRGGADITLSFSAEIRQEWLKAAFPEEIKTVSRPALDKDMLTPVTETLTMYRDVIVHREISSGKKGKASSDLIAGEFIEGRHKFREWNEEVEEWLLRVEFISRACPDFGIAPLDEEDLKLVMAEICSGARSVAEATNRPVLPVLQNWFGWDKNRLIDQHAPQRLQMPGGRRARIRYPKNGEPYLEAKIQDLFSLSDTPRIAAGRVPLVVHILAPSMRPVQVTKDLKSFWLDSYPKLKPQLARRYPKHKWL
jgi:ATP-dependent helicase HrpB